MVRKSLVVPVTDIALKIKTRTLFKITGRA